MAAQRKHQKILTYLPWILIFSYLILSYAIPRPAKITPNDICEYFFETDTKDCVNFFNNLDNVKE